jgi:hypothetical protein
LDHVLRVCTLVVAAIAAIGSTSLSTLQHHSAEPPAHRVAARDTTRLPDLMRFEPRGRVLDWQTQRLMAAEAAAAHPAPPPPAPAPPPPPPAPARPPAAPPAAPAPAPPPASYPAGSVQDIITKAFAPYGPGAIAWGLRVARCESGYNPRAYNPAGPYYGLFQFLMSTFKATPYGGGDIYDPAANANAAAWKFANGGAPAWGCN